MEVRDPLYGLIEYDDKEERIMNTRLFQRLRGIKQLALANFVYPGAHHTRFEHSLGVMHLCGRIGRELEMGEDIIKILRLAGLLHDIGHGPFSHVSEQIMDKNIDKSILIKYKAHNAHELMSIRLIEQNEEIKSILSEGERNNIITLLQKQLKRSIEKDIVSGPLDVDKFDYLRRDSYFAGVEYGKFDLDKVIESMVPVELGRDGTQLGIKEEGIHAIEQLLLAKYHMNVQVYQHRIRRITDAMLVRGVEFALEERIEDVENVYKFNNGSDYLSHFIQYDDTTLVHAILSKSNGWAKKYFESITNRKLFKEIFDVEINKGNFDDGILLMNARDPSNDQMEQIGGRVAEILKVPRELVIIDRKSTSNPTFKDYRVKIAVEDIMVKTRLGKRKAFADVSEIFSNPSVDPDKEMLYIYAPLDSITTHDKRQDFIRDTREAIMGIIKEELA
ncbi:MAG: HD domain-containing protein [Methanosarcinales archaeon]|nr:MAG: HD domain-containing protein [Methanosarcinales archaeon]